jgi:hypothetical protein
MACIKRLGSCIFSCFEQSIEQLIDIRNGHEDV